jgi:hypothetical protein
VKQDDTDGVEWGATDRQAWVRRQLIKVGPDHDERTRYLREELLWMKRPLPMASRLAWLMTERARKSGRFYMTDRNIRLALDARSDELVPAAMRQVCEVWKLFRWNQGKKAYIRNMLPDETAKEFKCRVRRAIDPEVAAAWVLLDITWRPQPAPHTNEEFAEDIGRSLPTVRRAVARIVKRGFFVRWGGVPGQKSYYLRPDADAENFNMEQRYGEQHESAHTHQRATRLKRWERLYPEPEPAIEKHR